MNFIWLEDGVPDPDFLGKNGKRILIVEDIPRWERLLKERLGDRVEITVVHSIRELKEILSSGCRFFATALDGWLGEDSTLPFVQPLLKKSKLVISTSQDMEMRKKMLWEGCQAGGNKWDFVDLLTDLLLERG